MRRSRRCVTQSPVQRRSIRVSILVQNCFVRLWAGVVTNTNWHSVLSGLTRVWFPLSRVRTVALRAAQSAPSVVLEGDSCSVVIPFPGRPST